MDTTASKLAAPEIAGTSSSPGSDAGVSINVDAINVVASDVDTVNADAVTVHSFQISHELAYLDISKAQYLEEHKDLQFLAAGCLVFHGDHLLLVQRAANERTFRNRWEIPGGQCDNEDPTILYSAARELLEEAGLHVTKFNYQVGKNERFETGPMAARRHWQKFSFVVDVEEAGPQSNLHQKPVVKLDPVEHQRFLWVTQEEIARRWSNNTKFSFTSEAQRVLMLEAFRRRKAEKRSQKKALKDSQKLEQADKNVEQAREKDVSNRKDKNECEDDEQSLSFDDEVNTIRDVPLLD
jgi:8-oxo-dGTP pyrophosphatase MutT (NUDIX family)